MTERPIIFSAPMVRAILEGRKTQTRRIFAPERMTWKHDGRYYETHALRAGELITTGMGPFVPSDWLHYSPYGQPCDRLWVREAWRAPASLDDLSGKQIAQHCLNAGYSKPWCPIQYEADGARTSEKEWREFGSHPSTSVAGRYRHARFMPRWASRILLEITDVRVERVQAIDDGDALEEGIHTVDIGSGYSPRFSAFSDSWQAIVESQARAHDWPRDAFRDLWNAINALRGFGWNANPWVWCLTFKRVEDGNRA